MKIKKIELAKWLANEESDLTGDIRGGYFTNHQREITTKDEFIKDLMKKDKSDLVEIIYNHSSEGQKFAEKNNLV